VHNVGGTPDITIYHNLPSRVGGLGSIYEDWRKEAIVLDSLNTPENWIRFVSASILAVLLPVAIMISRDRLRHYRRGLLIALEDWMGGFHRLRPMPSFEAARIKYELTPRGIPEHYGEQQTNKEFEKATKEETRTRETWFSYALPGVIYSGLTALGFITAIMLSSDTRFWSSPNFILSGMHNVDLSLEAGKLTSPALTAYQWNSGAAIVAGFVGAYLFTLQYLVQRVRSYELSPMSFLVASVSLLEGCFVVAIVRHLIPDHFLPQLIALAFILGYFPTFGVVLLIERLRISQLKSVDPNAYNRRSLMPTDIIDGIDMLTKFRLVEAGIRDVQNLAAANPVLVYVETPFGLLEIVDWIAQAQLILAVGSTGAANLRAIGVRTIFDLPPLRVSETSRRMVLRIVQPDLADDPSEVHFDAFYQMITHDIHVRRLKNFWKMMERLVDDPELPPPSRPTHTQSETYSRE
jgi:hypothetical protein